MQKGNVERDGRGILAVVWHSVTGVFFNRKHLFASRARKRVDEGIKPLTLPSIKVDACTVVGTGEEYPLCDPASELREGGSWRLGQI